MRPSALVWRSPEGTAVACALLSACDERVGPLRVRCAYLNATGAPDVASEHNDILSLPEHRAEVLDDLVRLLRESRVDKVVLTGCREATAVRLRDRWSPAAHEGYFSEAPFIALSRLRSERTPYVRCLSPTARWQVRRSIRLYRAEFGSERVDVASPGAQSDEWFDEMVALHEHRWRLKGRRGSFGRPEVLSFHQRLLAGRGRPSDEGLTAELLRVSFGEEAIGYIYTLGHRGCVSFYQSGLRYHDDNRLKPGFVSHALAAEHYLQAGAAEYDFLGGEPEPVRYKRSLSTDVRMLAWLQLTAPTFKMRALGKARRLARGVRGRASTDGHGAIAPHSGVSSEAASNGSGREPGTRVGRAAEARMAS